MAEHRVKIYDIEALRRTLRQILLRHGLHRLNTPERRRQILVLSHVMRQAIAYGKVQQRRGLQPHNASACAYGVGAEGSIRRQPHRGIKHAHALAQSQGRQQMVCLPALELLQAQHRHTRMIGKAACLAVNTRPFLLAHDEYCQAMLLHELRHAHIMRTHDILRTKLLRPQLGLLHRRAAAGITRNSYANLSRQHQKPFLLNIV